MIHVRSGAHQHMVLVQSCSSTPICRKGFFVPTQSASQRKSAAQGGRACSKRLDHSLLLDSCVIQEKHQRRLAAFVILALQDKPSLGGRRQRLRAEFDGFAGSHSGQRRRFHDEGVEHHLTQE